jgi:hypothetical protein
LPITLSPEECDRLEMLSHSFGAGFSLNNVICIAFRFLAEDPSGRLSGKYESDRPGTRILKIRPTEDSMMAILKSNKKDAGTHLARVGVNELYLRLFKAA